MDHNGAADGNLNHVSGHSDHAGRAGGDPVNNNGLLPRQGLELVINGHAGIKIPAD